MNKPIFPLAFILPAFCVSIVLAQEVVQQMPTFNGDLGKYEQSHISYPKEALAKGVQGTVYVTFLVEKDGRVSNVKLLRGVEHSLDSAAIALVTGMPLWTPGSQGGKPVRVQFNLPVNFKLPDGQQQNMASPTGMNQNGDTDKILTIARQMPKFNGNLNQWVVDHLNYPPTNAQGTVFLSFVVEKDGSISNIKVIRSVERSLDSAAEACVRSMPRWIPGKQDGKTVRVQYNLPINFQMPEIAPASVNPTTPPRVK